MAFHVRVKTLHTAAAQREVAHRHLEACNLVILQCALLERGTRHDGDMDAHTVAVLQCRVVRLEP